MSAGDWTEDFSHENGNYQNKCIQCGNLFKGHKRRVICKTCMEPDWNELAKKKRPEDTKDNKAWSGAWLEGEMVGFAKCMVNNVLPNRPKEVARPCPNCGEICWDSELNHQAVKRIDTKAGSICGTLYGVCKKCADNYSK